MIARSESEILKELSNSLTDGMTIRAVSIALKKPYPHVHRHMQSLITKGLVTKRDVGASCLCRINLRDEAAILALSGIALEESRAKSPKLAERIAEQIGEAMAVVQDKRVVVINDGEIAAPQKKALKTMKTPVEVVDSSAYFSSDHQSIPLILSGQYRYLKHLSEVRR